LSNSTKDAGRLLKYTNQRVVLGDDFDEAITYAVAQVYPRASEDAQADVYAAIRACFDEYPNGTSRKIAVVDRLRKYQLSRIYG